MNILFTCVGRRNYLLQYFRESLEAGDVIFAADMSDTAPGMAEADRAIIVPSVYDETYSDVVTSVVRENKIDAIISLNDLEAPILSKARKQIEVNGCRLIVSDDRVIDLTFDKKKTADFLTSIGLNTPLTYTSIVDFKGAYSHGDIDFPIVVKPRWGSASIGIEMPESREEFDLVRALSDLKLGRTILATASAVDKEQAILYQEKVTGTEYGIDVLNDFEGNYVGTFAKKKLSMRAGETDKAKTVIIPEIEEIGRTISKHLRHIGNLDCDVLERNGTFYVLEMNARFGGGYPFSHEGGAHGTACYVSWLRGELDVTRHLNYAPGLTFSKCDRLIRVK